MEKLKPVWVTVTVLLLATSACDQLRKPAAIPDKPVSKLSERVYVIHGPNELPDKNNRGFMNNPGFVVTKKGVVIVDPGSSHDIGKMMLAKIREVSSLPVVAVFNTHIHGDHWLGNSAVREAYPKAIIYAHTAMKAMAESGEGDSWIATLNKLTEGAITGTKVIGPNAIVDNEETLAIGGVHFRIYHNGRAHTDTDVMIEVVEDRVMFLGDNGFSQRIGRLDDGSFKGNIAALKLALASKSTIFVPGHGPSGGREIPTAYMDYLSTIQSQVSELYKQGIADFEMKQKMLQPLDPYKRWYGFNDEVGKHISLCYLEIEQDAF